MPPAIGVSSSLEDRLQRALEVAGCGTQSRGLRYVMNALWYVQFSTLFCCNSTYGVLSNPGRRLKPSLLQSYVAVTIVLGHPGGTIREQEEPGIRMARTTFSGGSRTQSFSRMFLPVLTRGQPDRRLGAAL